MLTVEESIVIHRPRPDVWAFMMDPDNVPVYNSNVVDYELVSGGKHEVGRVCRGTVKVAGRRLAFTDELVEVQEGHGGRLVSEEATVPYTLSFWCEDDDEGTKLTWHQEMESLRGVFTFADPIILKLYSRDLRSNLEKLKTILEM